MGGPARSPLNTGKSRSDTVPAKRWICRLDSYSHLSLHALPPLILLTNVLLREVLHVIEPLVSLRAIVSTSLALCRLYCTLVCQKWGQ